MSASSVALAAITAAAQRGSAVALDEVEVLDSVAVALLASRPLRLSVLCDEDDEDSVRRQEWAAVVAWVNAIAEVRHAARCLLPDELHGLL